MTKGAARVTPDVLIILDASESMNDDPQNTSCFNGCGLGSKWAQAVGSINQVVSATQTNVNWGLKFFADDASCSVGAGVAVGVGASKAAQIAAAIAARTNGIGGVAMGSQTPTRAGVAQGAAYLGGLNDMAPKYIVLATDGLPNCAATGDQTLDDSGPAVAAVAAAHAAHIPVFVIGVSTAGLGSVDTTLAMMANAGGLPRSGSPTYYPVSSADELSAALNTLVGVVASCNFALGAAPNNNTSTDYIDIFGDGTKIPRDTGTPPTNGWDYTDASHTAVQIYGPTCTEIMSGRITNVTVTFRCIVG